MPLLFFPQRDPSALVGGRPVQYRSKDQAQLLPGTTTIRTARTHEMTALSKTKGRADHLLKKAQKLGTGEDLESLGNELEWLTAYARIAQQG